MRVEGWAIRDRLLVLARSWEACLLKRSYLSVDLRKGEGFPSHGFSVMIFPWPGLPNKGAVRCPFSALYLKQPVYPTCYLHVFISFWGRCEYIVFQMPREMF